MLSTEPELLRQHSQKDDLCYNTFFIHCVCCPQNPAHSPTSLLSRLCSEYLDGLGTDGLSLWFEGVLSPSTERHWFPDLTSSDLSYEPA